MQCKFVTQRMQLSWPLLDTSLNTLATVVGTCGTESINLILITWMLKAVDDIYSIAVCVGHQLNSAWGFIASRLPAVSPDFQISKT